MEKSYGWNMKAFCLGESSKSKQKPSPGYSDLELTRVARSGRQDDLGPAHATDELVRLAGAHNDLVMVTPLNNQSFHRVDEQICLPCPTALWSSTSVVEPPSILQH